MWVVVWWLLGVDIGDGEEFADVECGIVNEEECAGSDSVEEYFSDVECEIADVKLLDFDIVKVEEFAVIDGVEEWSFDVECEIVDVEKMTRVERVEKCAVVDGVEEYSSGSLLPSELDKET